MHFTTRIHRDAPELPPSSHGENHSTAFTMVAIGFLTLRPTFVLQALTDPVLNKVLRFLKAFFVIFGHVFAPCVTTAAKLLQTFLYLTQKVQKGQEFHTYPVCKRCGTCWHLMIGLWGA